MEENIKSIKDKRAAARKLMGKFARLQIKN
jgi:hypothetical protein